MAHAPVLSLLLTFISLHKWGWRLLVSDNSSVIHWWGYLTGVWSLPSCLCLGPWVGLTGGSSCLNLWSVFPLPVQGGAGGSQKECMLPQLGCELVMQTGPVQHPTPLPPQTRPASWISPVFWGEASHHCHTQFPGFQLEAFLGAVELPSWVGPCRARGLKLARAWRGWALLHCLDPLLPLEWVLSHPLTGTTCLVALPQELDLLLLVFGSVSRF